MTTRWSSDDERDRVINNRLQCVSSESQIQRHHRLTARAPFAGSMSFS